MRIFIIITTILLSHSLKKNLEEDHTKEKTIYKSKIMIKNNCTLLIFREKNYKIWIYQDLNHSRILKWSQVKVPTINHTLIRKVII